ncbi:MAG TPA: DNA-binding protein [Gammaproteobacteria bacterium]|nr:DNA-binding protein [Gammaproteobacteria bacterium]
MPALTIKNIPDSLYNQLKIAAKAHHRSLNSEFIYCVEQALGTHKIDIAAHLATAAQLREKTAAHPINEEQLIAAKNHGRP